jgi:hypothetical protein
MQLTVMRAHWSNQSRLATHWPAPTATFKGRQRAAARWRSVKTARFSKVVEKCGEPETHLLLMDPAKDRTLQAALKAQRVMTVFQDAVGTKTDRGEIGFRLGRNRQFLVFPKSLKSFAGQTVVGIKYDLISSPEIPKSKRAKALGPPKKPKLKPAAKAGAEEAEPPPRHNVVAFKRPSEKDEEDDENDEVAELKRRVQHAMAVLEEGKAVAAFNLLKRIVE